MKAKYKYIQVLKPSAYMQATQGRAAQSMTDIAGWWVGMVMVSAHAKPTLGR